MHGVGGVGELSNIKHQNTNLFDLCVSRLYCTACILRFWWSLVSNPRRAHHTVIMASSAGVHERIGVYRTAHDLVPKIERQEFFVNMVAVVALYFLEVIRVITNVLCPAVLSSTTK